MLEGLYLLGAFCHFQATRNVGATPGLALHELSHGRGAEGVVPDVDAVEPRRGRGRFRGRKSVGIEVPVGESRHRVFPGLASGRKFARIDFGDLKKFLA